ncbi:MAG: hypothetical protein ACOX88_09260 [Christensenellales bacterium]|jgi:hypothetical protein
MDFYSSGQREQTRFILIRRRRCHACGAFKSKINKTAHQKGMSFQLMPFWLSALWAIFQKMTSRLPVCTFHFFEMRREKARCPFGDAVRRPGDRKSRLRHRKD